MAALLRGARRIAEHLRMEGGSCLVHCSDGWDRTAQLCSLAQARSSGAAAVDRDGFAQPHDVLL